MCVHVKKQMDPAAKWELTVKEKIEIVQEKISQFHLFTYFLESFWGLHFIFSLGWQWHDWQYNKMFKEDEVA